MVPKNSVVVKEVRVVGYIGIMGHMDDRLKNELLAKLKHLPCKYADIIKDSYWSTIGGADVSVLIVDPRLLSDAQAVWDASEFVHSWSSNGRCLVCLLGDAGDLSWLIKSIRERIAYCAVGVEESVKLINECYAKEGYR